MKLANDSARWKDMRNIDKGFIAFSEILFHVLECRRPIREPNPWPIIQSCAISKHGAFVRTYQIRFKGLKMLRLTIYEQNEVRG